MHLLDCHVLEQHAPGHDSLQCLCLLKRVGWSMEPQHTSVSNRYRNKITAADDSGSSWM
jgi:hypothetical protein